MKLSLGNELFGLFVLSVGEVRSQEKVEDSNLKGLVFPQSGGLSNSHELTEQQLVNIGKRSHGKESHGWSSAKRP